MKSRYIKATTKAAHTKCPQICSACARCRTLIVEETKTLVNTGQLYAREAEDYFYHFIPSPERNSASLAFA